MGVSTKTKTKSAFITKEKYDSIDQCECGGPVFKFHDTSKNVFIAKCGYFSKIMEIDKKTKKITWVNSKKPACDWVCKYNGERPVFKEINNSLNTFIEKNVKDPHKQLEEKLKLLFRFLHVSNHTSTLDEINLLVKNNLYREPRKTFYYPSIGLFMRVSHYEPFDEYEKRIFSKKIIDVSSNLYDKYLAQKALLERKQRQKEKKEMELLRKKSQRKKEAEIEEPAVSQFIVVDSDADRSDDDNSEDRSDENSDDETSDYGSQDDELSENEPSDDDDNQVEQPETEENDEPFVDEEYYDDDYDDNEVDYYDD